MKIENLDDNSCKIIFEDNEKFAGQTLLIGGKKLAKGFLIDFNSLFWITYDQNDKDKNTEQKSSVGDTIKKALIAYVVALGLLQGINFFAGNIFSSIAENQTPNYDSMFDESQLNTDEEHKF